MGSRAFSNTTGMLLFVTFVTAKTRCKVFVSSPTDLHLKRGLESPTPPVPLVTFAPGNIL